MRVFLLEFLWPQTCSVGLFESGHIKWDGFGRIVIVNSLAECDTERMERRGGKSGSAVGNNRL